MKPEPEVPSVGGELGHEAITEIEQHGEHYCRHERQRIELTNQPRIFAFRAQCGHLNEQAADLEDRIHKAPPTGDVQTRRRKMWWYRILVLLLSISAFAFLIMAFEPFRMGWKAWLYSLGIAVLTPLLVDKTLDAWEGRATLLWRAIVTTACLAAFGAQLLLAVVRGNIMREQVANPTPAIVIQDEAIAPEKTQNNFYDESLGYLQLVMVLFAGALELGAGVAWREARRWGSPIGEDRETLWVKLGKVRQEMIRCAYSASILEGEGAAFEAQFRRDFDRSFMKRARNGVLNKLLTGLIAVLLVGQANAAAPERLNLVIAIDLTASVTGTKDLDGKSEFDRNIVAVSRLIATLPPGAKVTIIGITDRSFSRPYILLAAQVDQDEGFFKERIASARQALIRAWEKRSATAASHFQHTDIFGSLAVAAELVPPRLGWKNVLVILSDMRHDMPRLDISDSQLEMQKAIADGEKTVPKLDGMDVYVLGVDAADKSTVHWQRLREFWVKYFKQSGANLKSYTRVRELQGIVESGR